MTLTEKYIKENSYWPPEITQQILEDQKLRELIEKDELLLFYLEELLKVKVNSGSHQQADQLAQFMQKLRPLLEESKKW